MGNGQFRGNGQLSKYNYAKTYLEKSISKMESLLDTLINKEYFNQIKKIDDISSMVDSCITELNNTKNKVNSIISEIKANEANQLAEQDGSNHGKR